MLEKEPKHVSFLFFFKIKEPCPRWGAPVVECSIPNVNICRSLSLSFEWQIDMTSLCVGSQQTPGRDVQPWTIQLHQRVFISTCRRFFHSHNQLGSLTWFTLSRNQIWSNFSFTKFQVRRQSEAATQVNKSIILYYFPVFVDSWGEAKKIWWQTKNKTKTNSFPADWPLVLAIFCLAQPVENNNGPPVFLM